ncbi:hypothetical protein E3E11_02870 [Oecophyllibacter saccharovorans]|nr:hypothetical protein E3E11_02870 [Oecophyllibacter saccharovorans]
MLGNGITLEGLGMLKAVQALTILGFGTFVGFSSGRIDRKLLFLAGIALCCAWLLLSWTAVWIPHDKVKPLLIFMAAEICNGCSLALFQNNTNSYLIDIYQAEAPAAASTEKQSTGLEKLFGQLGKLHFFFMALVSLLSGTFYALFPRLEFLYAALLAAIIGVLAWYFLPPCLEEKSQKGGVFPGATAFRQLLTLCRPHKSALALFLLAATLFQVVIQYWQPMAAVFPPLATHSGLYGLILFLMLLAQSAAGHVLQKAATHFTSSNLRLYLWLAGGLSLFGFSAGLLWHCLSGLVIGLAAFMFVLRLTMLQLSAGLHAEIPSRLRPRYDMTLNTVLRLCTAAVLPGAGALATAWGPLSLLIPGIGFLLFLGLKPAKQSSQPG